MTQATENLQSRCDALAHAVGIPFTDGNRVDILKNGDRIFDGMLSGIRAARRSILFETFIYWSGSIADSFARELADRSREGLEVKVLLDAYGAFHMKKSHLELMRGAGVEVRHFKKLRTHFWSWDKRTHRKLLICDEVVAFAGGVGIGSEWEGDARDASEWRDTHFRFRGPSVAELAEAFWDNWQKTEPKGAGGQLSPVVPIEPPAAIAGSQAVLVVPTAPASQGGAMECLYDGLIALARERLIIATPYFTILERTRDQLLAKAAAGVTVEILLPGDKIDKWVAYLAANECLGPILSAGIVVRRYETSMMHGKVILVDDDLALVGSPNFNLRSLRKDYEVAIVVQDFDFCKTLHKNYLGDIAESRVVTLESVKPAHLIEQAFRKFLMRVRNHL